MSDFYIPEPNEKLFKVATQKKIDYPKIIDKIVYEDGIKTYFEGCPYPHKGLPNIGNALIAIGAIKKPLALLTKLRHPTWIKKEFLYYGAYLVNKHLLKDEYYCPTAREIKRVCEKLFSENFTQIITAILEYDNAYRYRVQDILGELRYWEKPRKEVARLFKIWYNREKGVKMKLKIKRFAKIINLILYIPKYKKLAKRFIQEIDIEKVKLDEVDKYWFSQFTDYDHT